MKKKQISTSQARKNFSDLINAAKYGDQETVILKNGEPAASIVPFRRTVPDWELKLRALKQLGPFVSGDEADSMQQKRDTIFTRHTDW